MRITIHFIPEASRAASQPVAELHIESVAVKIAAPQHERPAGLGFMTNTLVIGPRHQPVMVTFDSIELRFRDAAEAHSASMLLADAIGAEADGIRRSDRVVKIAMTGLLHYSPIPNESHDGAMSPEQLHDDGMLDVQCILPISQITSELQ